MENPPKQFIKDEETLKRQLALSNEASEDGSENKVSIPSEYKDYSLTELGEEVKRLQQIPSHELNYTEYNLVIQYPLYLKNLRNLRQGQSVQIHEALGNSEAGIERREAFLSTISWSGPIQEKILNELELGKYSSGRVLNDTQISEASSTRENFITALDTYAKINPDVLIGHISKLSSLVSHEQLRPLIESCISKKPSLVSIHHTELSNFYGDEFKDIFIKTAKLSKNGSFVNSLATDETLRNLIGKEQGIEITSSAISNDLSVLDSLHSQEIWESGLVDPFVINEVLATKLPTYKGYDVISFVKKMWPYLDDTGRSICQNFMEQKLHDDDQSFLNLNPYEDIINEEVLREKARSLLLSNTNHPTITISEMSQLEKYLSTAELQGWIAEYLNGGKSSYRLGNACCEEFMLSDTFTEQEKDLLVQRLLKNYPQLVFTNPDIYLSSYPSEERQKIMVQLGEYSSCYQGIQMLHEWLPYTTDSTEEQKAILAEHCLKDYDLSFLSWYEDKNANNPNQELFRSLINKEDLIGIIEKKAEVDTSAVLRNIEEIRTILGGDEELKSLTDRLYASSPFAFFEELDKVVYLYTPIELEIMLWENMGTFKFSYEIFKHIGTWGPRLGTEKTDEICQANMDTLCLNPHGLKIYLETKPDTSIADYIPHLIQSNPAVAMYFLHGNNEGEEYRNTGINISFDEIRDTALNAAQTSPLSKSLTEFWSTIDITDVTGSGVELSTLRKTFFIYVHQAELGRSGLSETLERILNNEPKDAKKEKVVLQNMVSYLHLIRMGAVKPEMIDQLQTTVDLEQALFSGMSQLLNGNDEVNESERAEFFKTMKTPGPFLSYLAQYRDSPEHKKILTDIFNSITNNEFNEWKYGTKEDFDTLKNNGLLPKETSEEQYNVWKNDEQTSLFETLKATGEEVAEHIKKIIIQNSEHLGVHNFEESVKEPTVSLDEVKQELKLLGPLLAEIGKKLSILSKDPETPEEEKNSILAEKTKLEQLRNLLTRNRDLIRLTSISSEEIMSGYMIEGGKQVKSINRFLEDMRSLVPNEGQFVIDQIMAQANSLRKQGIEKENIVCKDSSDPKTTLEIGALPVESCQHYENGAYNECLLGYTEPNTKILVVRNEKGNIIARSVIRLLSAEGGIPALHVERIYSTSASAGVKRAIFEHAFSKATSLGVPLVANTEDVPTDFNFKIGQKIELISKGSRAPKVYVDSAGGSKSWGKYRINGSSIVTRS